jgi:hypothetical protein
MASKHRVNKAINLVFLSVGTKISQKGSIKYGWPIKLILDHDGIEKSSIISSKISTI